MEIRFVAFFSNAGVRLNEIRSILDEAKLLLDKPHPFATNTVFRTDGRKIIAEIGRHNGIQDVYDLKSKNFAMRVVVIDSPEERCRFRPRGRCPILAPTTSDCPKRRGEPSGTLLVDLS